MASIPRHRCHSRASGNDANDHGSRGRLVKKKPQHYAGALYLGPRVREGDDCDYLLSSSSVSDFGRTIGEAIMRLTTICEQRPIARETPNITV